MILYCDKCTETCVITGLPSRDYPECGFRQRPKYKAYQKAYRQRPEVKAKRKAYQQRKKIEREEGI